MAAPLAKGSRITGLQRQELAADLGRRYAAGESMRSLAASTGRSFGFVHGLLAESGVALRSRGGDTRGSAATAARTARQQAGAVAAAQGTGSDAVEGASPTAAAGSPSGSGKSKIKKSKITKDKTTKGKIGKAESGKGKGKGKGKAEVEKAGTERAPAEGGRGSTAKAKGGKGGGGKGAGKHPTKKDKR